MFPAAAWAWTWCGAAWKLCTAPLRSASKPGAGLTVTLRLPLTLAIIDGLLVRVGNTHFVLPLANSLECVELTSRGHRDAHGKHIANVRGRNHSLHPAERVLPDEDTAPGTGADHGGRNRTSGVTVSSWIRCWAITRR